MLSERYGLQTVLDSGLRELLIERQDAGDTVTDLERSGEVQSVQRSQTAVQGDRRAQDLVAESDECDPIEEFLHRLMAEGAPVRDGMQLDGEQPGRDEGCPLCEHVANEVGAVLVNQRFHSG